jgi:ornithine cyclodeaminase/alanine dehydrogenase-like protein (mu-crystallin family)
MSTMSAGPRTLDLDTVKAHLDIDAAIAAIEAGYVAYSTGRANVPPVGYLKTAEGETHIKYGHIEGGEYFVIKVASGFYNNPALGLASGSGLMLVHSAKTGVLEAILLDEGHLTNVRTAIGGLIAAKYLAPKDITGIGIVGAGVQGYLQLSLLPRITDCRKVTVWNRNRERAEALADKARAEGFDVAIADSTEQLARESNLIVTTTPATAALINADWVQPGTHITAVGADTPGKQELDAALVAKADVLVVDSVSQCADHGEVQTAIRDGLIDESRLLELGTVIADPQRVQRQPKTISIADLTGVAVQDIQIATAVLLSWQRSSQAD